MRDTLFVAIVHYHLRPGGVTRVIEHAVTALENVNARVVILTGEQPQPNSELIDKVRVIDGLGYHETSSVCSPTLLSERLLAEAKHAFGKTPDIWHFHNHSLGKNCALTEAVRILALKGHKILLQIHDFAEDGRPQLFQTLLRHIGNRNVFELGKRVYPQASHIHYAAINARDRALLARAGIPESRLHLLANPITFPAKTSTSRQMPKADLAPDNEAIRGSSAGDRLFLYCTRAIRRKNIGEFILWASIGDPLDRYAITMAPMNPLERPAYEQWVNFAKDCDIPIEFELGRQSGKSFHVLLQSAWAAVTTSITEGFGLAFLEPWLTGRPVYGRKLPEITDEFEAAGVDLSALYQQLLLPVKWIDRKVILKKIQTRLAALLSAYGREIQAGDTEKALAAAIDGDRIDFGHLDEELQQETIRKVAGSRSCKNELRPSGLAAAPGGSRMIESNCEVVKCVFSLENYSRQLMDIFRQLEKSKVEPTIGGIDINKLLDTFLASERFYLLRS